MDWIKQYDFHSYYQGHGVWATKNEEERKVKTKNIWSIDPGHTELDTAYGTLTRWR